MVSRRLLRLSTISALVGAILVSGVASAEPPPEPEVSGDAAASSAPEPVTDPEADAALKGSEATSATAAAASGKEPLVGIGIVADLMISSGRPGATEMAAGETVPSGSRGMALPLLLSFKGYVPLTAGLRLVPSLEAGWFRMGGEGSRDLPRDPDFGSFAYSWRIDSLPIFAGVALSLQPSAALPLQLSFGAGFAGLYAWAESTYEKDGEPSVTNSVQSDWGFGHYLGAEAALDLGPGSVTLELRYSSARTDLDFKDIYDSTYNRELGELEGSHVMLGYRLDFPL